MGPRVETKQLNSLHGISTGEVPEHERATASQPGVQHDYTVSNTLGYKVINALLKIVCMHKYYTSDGEVTVVRHANRPAEIHMHSGPAKRHSHEAHDSGTAKRHTASRSDEGGQQAAYLNHCKFNVYDEKLYLNTVPFDSSKTNL